ncbi:hypothetical protein QFC21_002458 [Naganishia friedmannii]|uniref:Uncharacterized protein n=1 Tax=Naganishia friedmannii TaxID=89922 RepID=A0ACC2VYQ8_9TREE|nr:hypothetical protein QFC21_002458 [Naganishia friedmannii]
MSSTIDSILAALPRDRPQLRISRDLIIGAVLGLTLTLSSASLALWMSRPRWWTRGWEDSGSNTPLEGVAARRTEERSPVEIRSNEVVHGVLGLIVIENAEAAGILVPNTGCKIFEGTVGSTGISIATVGQAKILPAQKHWNSAIIASIQRKNLPSNLKVQLQRTETTWLPPSPRIVERATSSTSDPVDCTYPIFGVTYLWVDEIDTEPFYSFADQFEVSDFGSVYS